MLPGQVEDYYQVAGLGSAVEHHQEEMYGQRDSDKTNRMGFLLEADQGNQMPRAGWGTQWDLQGDHTFRGDRQG